MGDISMGVHPALVGTGSVGDTKLSATAGSGSDVTNRNKMACMRVVGFSLGTRHQGMV